MIFTCCVVINPPRISSARHEHLQILFSSFDAPSFHLDDDFLLVAAGPQRRREEQSRSTRSRTGDSSQTGSMERRLAFEPLVPSFPQGFLYKKGTNSINREWKKKYVVLLDDGRLIYHPSLHVSRRKTRSSLPQFVVVQDYENDSHGKEIVLQRTTIKIPGSNKPRIALRSTSNDNKLNDVTSTDGAIIISNSSVTPGSNLFLFTFDQTTSSS